MQNNPSPGHEPALPEGGQVLLSDFDPKAQQLLRNLSAGSIRSLARQARCDLNHSDERTYTRDPMQAAREAPALLARKAGGDLDHGTQEALYSLPIAVAMLGREDDLDGADCRALAWLLNRAEDLLDQDHRSHAEARRRLHVGTGRVRI